MKVLLVVVSVLLGLTAAQKIVWKSCPNVTLKENFDIQKFMGRWYEIERFFLIYEMGLKCVTADYTLFQNGTVEVVNKGISYLTLRSSKEKIIRGTAVAPNPKTPAKLVVTFPMFLGLTTKGRFWVLDTDYHNYAVVFSCSDGFLFSTQSAWILSRRPVLASSIRMELHDKLKAQGVEADSFRRTDQSCFDE